ncbi:MAG: TrkA family potassium uptake protein [Fimbriimonadaceae bacterium]|nr:TrkA family potassium uptake protein [Fimbriimonadaceae bacterium]
MYMVLVGGGNVGLELAKRLIEADHEVLVLEKDARSAVRLIQLIGEENVLIGDGCEVVVQKSAGLERADVVVAVTGEDEDNLVVCQMAKALWNVDRVLARVNDPDHVEVFKQLGIDDTVSATGIIYSLLEQQISPDVVVPVGALGRGNLEIVEVELSSRSPVVGKKVRDLVLPAQTNIIWIVREDHGLGVTGDTDLLVGDMVVALVNRDHSIEFRAALHPVMAQG